MSDTEFLSLIMEYGISLLHQFHGGWFVTFEKELRRYEARGPTPKAAVANVMVKYHDQEREWADNRAKHWHQKAGTA